MPAHSNTRANDGRERTTNVPRASVIIGVLIICICFFIAAGISAPMPGTTPSTPAATLTPDDPAAATPVAIPEIGR